MPYCGSTSNRRRNVIGQDFHLGSVLQPRVGSADLLDDGLQPFIDAIDQNPAPVFRAENDVVLAGVDHVVVAHVLHRPIIQTRAIDF